MLIWTNCWVGSRYVLDIGQSQDWLALQVALAPCLIGYGDIAKRLHADPKTKREGNIYWKWIENYVADDYREAVSVGSGKWTCGHVMPVYSQTEALLEKNAVLQSPSRIEELVKIFIHATKVGQVRDPTNETSMLTVRQMETGFWDMGAGNAWEMKMNWWIYDSKGRFSEILCTERVGTTQNE